MRRRKTAKKSRRKVSRRKKLYGAAAKSHAKKTSRRKRRKTSARKTRKASRKRARRGVRKRPTIIVSRSGRYYRPRRSKFFKRPRRVNGRRRRRNGSSLMSGLRSALQLQSLSRYASIGGGIFAGTLFSRMLNTGVVPFTSIALPAAVTGALQKARPLHGLLHIVLGSLVASKDRNKYVKDAGIGIAALGGFDIVMQIASRVGIPGLPTFSGMNVDLLGRARPRSVSGMNVSLRGMNVSMMGEVRPGAQTETHLADALNEMVS